MNLLLDFDVTCMILGGGQGARLHPLTKDRAKPAVPVAGKYRLIDIPISNCLHAGMNRIYVLTQFNSTSLHRHIHHTYRFDRYSRGFIEILAAQQTPQLADQASWYQGTADAVRKNLVRLRDAGGQDVLILSGDQIYQLDFQELMSSHRGQSNLRPTEVTIAALLVPGEKHGAPLPDRPGHPQRAGAPAQRSGVGGPRCATRASDTGPTRDAPGRARGDLVRRDRFRCRVVFLAR